MFHSTTSKLEDAAPVAPRSAAILCFPGLRAEEIAAPLRLLAARRDEASGGPSYDVALVSPGAHPARTEAGFPIGLDRFLSGEAPAFDLLFVPCAFARAEAFAAPAAIASLVALIRRAGRTGLFAATRPLTQAARIRLRDVSSTPPAEHWHALQPIGDPKATEFAADGRLLWATGADAGADLVARLARDDRERFFA